MSTRRVRLNLGSGILGLACALPAPAQNLTAPRGAAQVRTRPATRQRNADGWRHRLNTAAGDAMLHVRQVDKARLLIVRGLTNDFTPPYPGTVKALSKQQRRWLAGGFGILTTETAPGGTQAQLTPEGTNTEQNLNNFAQALEDHLAAGGSYDDSYYDHNAGPAHPEDSQPAGSDRSWTKMTPKWNPFASDLWRFGDAAQSGTLRAQVDYFDAHWSELSEENKRCIDKRLEAARPGLTYEEFGNRLKVPKSYPQDGLTPEERG